MHCWVITYKKLTKGWYDLVLIILYWRLMNDKLSEARSDISFSYLSTWWTLVWADDVIISYSTNTIPFYDGGTSGTHSHMAGGTSGTHS